MNTTQSTSNEVKSNSWFSGWWASSKSQTIAKTQEVLDEKVQEAAQTAVASQGVCLDIPNASPYDRVLLRLKEIEEAKSKSLQELEQREFIESQAEKIEELTKIRARALGKTGQQTVKVLNSKNIPYNNAKSNTGLSTVANGKRTVGDTISLEVEGAASLELEKNRDEKLQKQKEWHRSYVQSRALRNREPGEVLDLAWRQDVYKKHSFEKILKDAWHVKEIDLTCSNIQDESLQEGLRLSGNMLHLESIRLDYTYLSKESLKRILESFPKIKALHVSYLYYVSYEEILDLVLPWVLENSKLEELSINFSTDSSMDRILALIDALPKKMKSFHSSIPYRTHEETAMFFRRLSARCGKHLQSLKINLAQLSDKLKNFTDQDMALLPTQFPNLHCMQLDNIYGLSSSVVRDAYIKWEKLEELSLDNFMLDADDLLKVVQSTKKLRSFELTLFDLEKYSEDLLLNVAQSLVENSESTLQQLSINGYTVKQEAKIDPVINTLRPILPQLKLLELSNVSNGNDELMKFILENISDNLKHFRFWWPYGSKQTISPKVLGNFYVELGKKAPNIEYLILEGDIYERLDHLYENLETSKKMAQNFGKLKYLDFSSVTSWAILNTIEATILDFIFYNPNLSYIQPALRIPDDYPVSPGWQFFDANNVLSLQRIQSKIGRSVFIETADGFYSRY